MCIGETYLVQQQMHENRAPNEKEMENGDKRKRHSEFSSKTVAENARIKRTEKKRVAR